MTSTAVAIMTFNIWCDGVDEKQPLSQTARVIRESGADIVGLQEAPKNAQAIADMLGWRHVHIHKPSSRRVLSRYEIVDQSPTGMGVLLRISASQSLWLFNVHLPHAPYQPYQLLHIPYADAPFLRTEAELIAAARAARSEAVAELLAEIESVRSSRWPIFVTGDFNEPSHLDWTPAAAKVGRHPIAVAYPTSTAFADAGLRDAYRAAHPDEVAAPGFTWTPLTAADDPKDHHDRIDFVMYSLEGVNVREVKIVGES